MAEIIHGKSKALAGTFEPPFYKCPVCEELHSTYIFVYSKYIHVFWIPVFPYEKEVVANCSECGFVRDEMRFGPNLLKEYEGVKKNYKHPLKTWALTIIAILAIFFFIIS